MPPHVRSPLARGAGGAVTLIELLTRIDRSRRRATNRHAPHSFARLSAFIAWVPAGLWYQRKDRTPDPAH